MATNRLDRVTMPASNKRRTEGKPDTSSASYNMPLPDNSNTGSRMAMIDELKYFLYTAANSWDQDQSAKRFPLPSGESISCVLWNGAFYITGTDIVRTLNYRFHCFGRPVTNPKKFEEGIFSDLRNLKPGTDARLEEPKSELLDMLYKNNCIRTQKKQKVFYWYSVPHDRLFLDALERDLKREKMNMEPTSEAVAEPATSFSLDSTQEVFDQVRKPTSLPTIATTNTLGDEKICPIPQSNLSFAPVAPFGPKPQLSMPVGTKISPASHSRTISATAARRSRVNSGPANLGGQQQQTRLTNHDYRRLSHASYLLPPSPTSHSNLRSSKLVPQVGSKASDALSAFDDEQTNAFYEISKSALSSPSSKSSGQDLADGVGQLEIRSPQSITQRKDLPSPSLDSKALEKTKKIFGAVMLLGGSPTYKQRRRRASSMSSAALGSRSEHVQLLQHGGPERIRRHVNCHLRTTSTPSVSSKQSVSTSRFVIAAARAGFKPNQLSDKFQQTNMSASMQPKQIDATMSSVSWDKLVENNSESDHRYTCPHRACTHVFQCFKHLEQHVHSHFEKQSFICDLCGKQFAHPDNLAQHQRTHEVLSYNDCNVNQENDDDSSQGDASMRQDRIRDNSSSHSNQQRPGSTVANQHDRFYSSYGSTDCNGSVYWSTGFAGSMSGSICSSQDSTSGLTQDLDFEMHDLPICSDEYVNDITVGETEITHPSSVATSAMIPLSFSASPIDENLAPANVHKTSDNHLSWWPNKEESRLVLSPVNSSRCIEDEHYSVSSSSSPLSMTYLPEVHPYQTSLDVNIYDRVSTGYKQAEATKESHFITSNSTPVTLTSEYKPEVFREEMTLLSRSLDSSQPFNASGTITTDDISSTSFPLLSDSNSCSYQENQSYNPFSFENMTIYTPYVAPAEVSMMLQ
ncbi:homeodomain transcription factor ste12 [Apophysomyces ossiformis]|uniref:Homeodomain transcription factor ste12 n=1 Tax=Apophysomyces ossiformis TaxID=679940 RepID=A0A8H7BUH9_9FUNG|nr:homeodomain transcription factor ste12 [Apophysomyces ossiformis]